MEAQPTDGVFDLRDGVGEEVDVVIADCRAFPALYLAFGVVGALPLHAHLRHDLVLQPVALKQVAALLLFLDGLLVLVIPLEARSHPEDPVAALTAQVFAIFDASLVDPDRLVQVICHGLAL